MTKIALVITAKNEERLLKRNIQYHFTIGVSKAYVYFDDATDGGPESLLGLEGVDQQNSVELSKYSNLEFLDKFTKLAHEHHTARQCLNTYDALLKSKRDGIDWLISIDADELVIVDKHKNEPIQKLFKNLDQNIDMVQFKVKEVAQRKLKYDNVFADETLFKYSRIFKNKFESPKKRIDDPFNKRTVKISYWTGQWAGKAGVKVGSGIIPKNVHRYVKLNGDKIKKVSNGLLLHYQAFDKLDFKKKFTNFEKHPNHNLSGTYVGHTKLLWRDIVNSTTLNQKYIDEYFENNVMFTEKEIRRMSSKKLGLFKRKEPAFETISSVQKAFKNLVN